MFFSWKGCGIFGGPGVEGFTKTPPQTTGFSVLGDEMYKFPNIFVGGFDWRAISLGGIKIIQF